MVTKDTLESALKLNEIRLHPVIKMIDSDQSKTVLNILNIIHYWMVKILSNYIAPYLQMYSAIVFVLICRWIKSEQEKSLE